MTRDELIEAIDALEADAAWPLIVEFVAAWMDHYDVRHQTVEAVIARWREEMA